MADAPMIWACRCGETELTVTSGKGARAICYCADCQAFARVLDKVDMLDPSGGSDLYQTVPDRVTVRKGLDNLAILRLSDKGPFRWYAACCRTPMANTGASRNLPFASFTVRQFDQPDLTGPVVARVNRKNATARIEEDAGSVRKLIAGFMGRALAARLTGRHKQTPFFDADGQPVAPVERLSREDRARAYGG